MYRIIDKRGTGKTSRLLLLAKETGATIVCANPKALEEKAKQLGLNGIKFISYDKFWIEYSDQNILIDELESFIKSYTHRCIGYSMSLED